MAHSGNEERSAFKAWEASLYRFVEEHWTRCPFCKDPYLKDDFVGDENSKPIGCPDEECIHLLGKFTNGEMELGSAEMETVKELFDLAEEYLSHDREHCLAGTGVVTDDLSGGDVPGLGWHCEYFFLENPDPKNLRKVIGCVLSNILEDPTNTFLHRLVVPDEQTIQGLQKELSDLSELMSALAFALAPPKPGP